MFLGQGLQVDQRLTVSKLLDVEQCPVETCSCVCWCNLECPRNVFISFRDCDLRGACTFDSHISQRKINRSRYFIRRTTARQHPGLLECVCGGFELLLIEERHAIESPSFVECCSLHIVFR